MVLDFSIKLISHYSTPIAKEENNLQMAAEFWPSCYLDIKQNLSYSPFFFKLFHYPQPQPIYPPQFLMIAQSVI